MKACFQILRAHARRQLHVKRVLRPVEGGHARECKRVIGLRTDGIVSRVVPRLREEERCEPDRPCSGIERRGIREEAARLDPDADADPVAGIDRSPGTEITECNPLRADEPVVHRAARREVELQRMRPRMRRLGCHHRVLKPVGEEAVIPAVRREPVIPPGRDGHGGIPVLSRPRPRAAVEDEIIGPHGPRCVLAADELHDYRKRRLRQNCLCGAVCIGHKSHTGGRRLVHREFRLADEHTERVVEVVRNVPLRVVRRGVRVDTRRHHVRTDEYVNVFRDRTIPDVAHVRRYPRCGISRCCLRDLERMPQRTELIGRPRERRARGLAAHRPVGRKRPLEPRN